MNTKATGRLAPMCDVSAMISELRNSIRYDTSAALTTFHARTGIMPVRITLEIEIAGKTAVTAVHFDFAL